MDALGADGVAEVLASITVCRRVLTAIACNRALDALADAGAGIDPARDEQRDVERDGLRCAQPETDGVVDMEALLRAPCTVRR
ncbi:MAG: hypothetical protein R2713_09300 [Ilumatobacteraceae bacterium]